MSETRIGKPCRHGHDGTRYASNGACVECTRARRAASFDPAKEAAYKRQYRAALKAPAVQVQTPAAFADLLGD